MKKNLAFVLTSMSVGALGVALGRFGTVGDEAVKGRVHVVPLNMTISKDLGPVTAMARQQIADTVCDEFERKGKGACNPNRLDYQHVHSPKRSVHRLDKHDIRVPVGRGPGYQAWLRNRLVKLCSQVDSVYGNGTCNPDTIDYEIRDIQTDGDPRTKVELRPRLFCTGVMPPTDPDAEVEP